MNALSKDFDGERFVTVYHRDRYGVVPATFDPHSSLEQVARALCDNEIADCPVVRILESWPDEGKCRDVTEDVARLIPAIVEEAEREWRKGSVQSCALDLMSRYIKVRKLEAA
jgi:hypothetical protein